MCMGNFKIAYGCFFVAIHLCPRFAALCPPPSIPFPLPHQENCSMVSLNEAWGLNWRDRVGCQRSSFGVFPNNSSWNAARFIVYDLDVFAQVQWCVGFPCYYCIPNFVDAIKERQAIDLRSPPSHPRHQVACTLVKTCSFYPQPGLPSFQKSGIYFGWYCLVQHLRIKVSLILCQHKQAIIIFPLSISRNLCRNDAFILMDVSDF